MDFRPYDQDNEDDIDALAALFRYRLRNNASIEAWLLDTTTQSVTDSSVTDSSGGAQKATNQRAHLATTARERPTQLWTKWPGWGTKRQK